MSFSRSSKSPRWTVPAFLLWLLSQGLFWKSWMWSDPNNGEGTSRKLEVRVGDTNTAGAGCPTPRQQRLWTCFGPRRTDRKTTPARLDHSMDPESPDSPDDDLALMTDLSRTYRSELSCIVDVASSICEKTYPDARVMGIQWTYKRNPRGCARTWRNKDGVSNFCTKCIQLGFLCLINISHGIVPVTASISCLHFHPLFYFLFYRGDSRYCLYIKDSIFYNLYKVLTKCWKCPIMF